MIWQPTLRLVVLTAAVMFTQSATAQHWKLFGSSGNSGSLFPECWTCWSFGSDDEFLYEINTSDGSTQFVRSLRNNVDAELAAGGWTAPFWGEGYRDGQSIAFNPNDGLLYHRNGTTGYRDAVLDPRAYDTRLIETYDPGPQATFTSDPVKIYNSLTDRPGGPVNDRDDPYHPIDGTIWGESRSFTWNPVDEYFILADNDGDIGYWDPNNGATTDAAVHVTSNSASYKGVSWYTTNVDGTGLQRFFTGVNDDDGGYLGTSFFELDSNSASSTYLEPLAMPASINLVGAPGGATVDQSIGMAQDPVTGDLYSVITLSSGGRHLVRYEKTEIDAFDALVDTAINAQYLGPTGVDITSITFVRSALPSDGDRHWIDPAGGLYQTPENWLPAEFPTAADDAIFDLDSSYTVTFADDAETAHAKVLSDDVTWNLQSHVYSLGHPTTIGDGAGDVGHLSVVDGWVQGITTWIARLAGSEGSLTVSTDGVWSHPLSDMVVGLLGDGALTVEDGGTVVSMQVDIGREPGATGQATVTGSTSNWLVLGDLNVGNVGSGDLDVVAGGSASADNLTAGEQAAAVATIDVSGTDSSLTVTNQLALGGEGTATLQVIAGGEVTADTLDMGFTLNGSGTVVVSGTDSSLSVDGVADIGRHGQGQMTISGGGAVSTGGSFIARDNDSSGDVVVSGTDSIWNAIGQVYVGGDQAVAGGGGNLTVSDNAVAKVFDGLVIWQTGAVHIDTGTVEALSATIHGTLDGSGLWDVINTTSHGTISPGHSTGKITVDGTLVLDDDSTLEIEIDGNTAEAEYDVLEVTGDGNARRRDGDCDRRGVHTGGGRRLHRDDIRLARRYNVRRDHRVVVGRRSGSASPLHDDPVAAGIALRGRW